MSRNQIGRIANCCCFDCLFYRTDSAKKTMSGFVFLTMTGVFVNPSVSRVLVLVGLKNPAPDSRGTRANVSLPRDFLLLFLQLVSLAETKRGRFVFASRLFFAAGSQTTSRNLASKHSHQQVTRNIASSVFSFETQTRIREETKKSKLYHLQTAGFLDNFI